MMNAPPHFWVYGKCTALYRGPRNDNFKKPIVLGANPVKIRLYDVVIYEEAYIKDTKVVDDFYAKEMVSSDSLYHIKFDCNAAISFPDKVFDDVSFIRDSISEAYFENPKLTETSKKGRNTYGTINGWGYFKVGNPRSLKKAEVVKPDVLTSVRKDIDVMGVESPEIKPIVPNNEMGCLPLVCAVLLSLLLPLFGLPIYSYFVALVILWFLFSFFFRRSNYLTTNNRIFTSSSLILSKSGCLWPAILMILLIPFSLNFCRTILNSKQQDSVIKDEVEQNRKIIPKKVLVQGETVDLIPLLNIKDSGIVDSVAKLSVDSVLIKGEKIPIPFTKSIKLLVYDFDVVDHDILSINFNGKPILEETEITGTPILVNIDNLRTGNNYMDLAPTSNGTKGYCTATLALITGGKLLYNKSVGSNAGTLMRLTFTNN